MAKPTRNLKGRTVRGKAMSQQPGKNRSSPRTAAPKPKLRFEWAKAISSDNWTIYQEAIQTIRAAGIPFMLGGGFAMAVYTGRWRNTKDIDLYIAKADRHATIEALSNAGFHDYFVHLPYDRKWIYRSTRSGVIVDIIWSMANQRAQVDQQWFARAPAIRVRGESLAVIPIEEFVWAKLYILQRDHCDWTDVLNVLYAGGKRLNWEHLLWRLEDDWPLLKGLLTLYGWLCPKQAAKLPDWLCERLNLDKPAANRSQYNRIRLLDSRSWFAATLSPSQPLEV